MQDCGCAWHVALTGLYFWSAADSHQAGYGHQDGAHQARSGCQRTHRGRRQDEDCGRSVPQGQDRVIVSGDSVSGNLPPQSPLRHQCRHHARLLQLLAHLPLHHPRRQAVGCRWDHVATIIALHYVRGILSSIRHMAFPAIVVKCLSVTARNTALSDCDEYLFAWLRNLLLQPLLHCEITEWPRWL